MQLGSMRENCLGELELGGSDEGPDSQPISIDFDFPEFLKIRQGHHVSRLLRASSQVDHDIRSPGKRDRLRPQAPEEAAGFGQG
jgi:hypothetical protein